MTDESASDGGGCLCCPKRTGQTPVRSLPRKENGKARTSMDEKSVRKSHGHHIPPAKGMGERALLLLGLLSLLTAADEVRHADAQHRATSDPSEGHAVKTGEREADRFGVADGDGDQTGGTIETLLNKVEQHEYTLPAIQREFVWRPDQICQLFDSLLQGYPFGTFLFWKIKTENLRQYQFYDFMRDYHQRGA